MRPVSSSCIMPCLMSRFFAISCSRTQSGLGLCKRFSDRSLLSAIAQRRSDRPRASVRTGLRPLRMDSDAQPELVPATKVVRDSRLSPPADQVDRHVLSDVCSVETTRHAIHDSNRCRDSDEDCTAQSDTRDMA